MKAFFGLGQRNCVTGTQNTMQTVAGSSLRARPVVGARSSCGPRPSTHSNVVRQQQQQRAAIVLQVAASDIREIENMVVEQDAAGSSGMLPSGNVKVRRASTA